MILVLFSPVIKTERGFEEKVGRRASASSHRYQKFSCVLTPEGMSTTQPLQEVQACSCLPGSVIARRRNNTSVWAMSHERKTRSASSSQMDNGEGGGDQPRTCVWWTKGALAREMRTMTCKSQQPDSRTACLITVTTQPGMLNKRPWRTCSMLPADWRHHARPQFPAGHRP